MDQLGFSILLQWRAQSDGEGPGRRRPAPEPGADHVTRAASKRRILTRRSRRAQLLQLMRKGEWLD
jgi:hypothetical protein